MYFAMSAAIVLATEETEPGPGASGFIFILLIGAALYFLLVGPQRRRMKAARAHAQDIRESLDYGDEVVTVGGIYGRVTSTTDDDVTIDVGGGMELRLAKRGIAERIGDDTE